MYFQIIRVILWPKEELEPRVLKLEPGLVNVISGSSKTGKSAVVPIIDYCLASRKCSIPVGTIREACSWFGIVVETAEGQKLLARREPGEAKQTGDMFIIEGDEVEIPPSIEEKNTTTAAVKNKLNQLAGLSKLRLNPNSESGFHEHVSFRDLMAFNFQPQYVVANPLALYYGADSFEHREKLKAAFPYVLGALTSEMLMARAEIEEVQKELRRAEAELKGIKNAVHAWQVDIRSWLRQAIELGLLSADTEIPDNDDEIINLLRRATLSDTRSAFATIDSIEQTLDRLAHLEKREGIVASDLSYLRQRLNELQKLVDSSEQFGDAIKIQKERLSLSDWLKNRVDAANDEIEALFGGRHKLDQLSEALSGIELQIHTQPRLSEAFDKERLRLRSDVELVTNRLAEIRQEITLLGRTSEAAQEAVYRQDQVAKFVGRIEQALDTFKRTNDGSELSIHISELNERLRKLRKTYSENRVKHAVNIALDEVAEIASEILPKLDGEWPKIPIEILIEDLTVRVVHENRKDYLWEIGSGANWLAYHVAVTLSFQRFFLRKEHHAVPSFLVYDQPSQVYFPTGFDQPSSSTGRTRDQDIAAVRAAFKAICDETVKAKGRLQAIVLDHAGKDVWGGLDGIHLTEEWRDGKALVPEEWIRN